MPGGDKTGPMGAGPMTGRGAGFCSGNQQPGFMSDIPGRGFGGGRGGRFGRGAQGGGRGWRHQYYATGQPGWARGGRFFNAPDAAASSPAADELAALKAQAGQLRATLADLERRVNEMHQKTGPQPDEK